MNNVYTTTTTTENVDQTERVTVQTQNIQPEIIQEAIPQALPLPQSEKPMHRTDIEGFGHHEDRVEME